MTSDLPYTTAQASLIRFLKHIQDAGVPGKVDRAYLRTVGFKSGNDSYLVPIIKKLGFVTPNGTPETLWRSYKDRQRAPKVLADGVRKAYSGLFATYPDAYRRDEVTLRNWFGPTTGYDEVKVGHAVSTFKTLCSLAEFDGIQTPPTPPPAPSTLPIVTDTPLPPSGSSTPGTPSININIELQLPPSTDGVSYEKFFEAMKKYLFPDGPARK